MFAFSISSQSAPRWLTPFIDIYELEDKVIVLADMPGVAREDVDIHTVGNQLTIRGQCSRQEGIRLIRECPYCDYHRSLNLSDAIDTERIQAQMRDGVLTLTFPKKPLSQPIEVPITIE